MAETPETKQAVAVVADLVSPFEPPSIAAVAEQILVEAIESCARKLGLVNLTAAIDLLEQEDRAACEYWIYSIATLVASSLGEMDDNLKAVYMLDCDATPEDWCFGTETEPERLIHLLVWTGRKTAAFDSLVEALDRALVQACSDTIGVRVPPALLDVQIVDDADVKQRHGYGAFRTWTHQRPIQVWERQNDLWRVT